MRIISAFNVQGKEIDLSRRPLSVLTDNDALIYVRESGDPDDPDALGLPDRVILFEASESDPHPESLREAAAAYLGSATPSAAPQEILGPTAIVASMISDDKALLRNFHHGDDPDFPLIRISALEDIPPFAVSEGQDPLDAFYSRINPALADPIVTPALARELARDCVEITYGRGNESLLSSCLAGLMARRASEIGHSLHDLSGQFEIAIGSDASARIASTIFWRGVDGARQLVDIMEGDWWPAQSRLIAGFEPTAWRWSRKPGARPAEECRRSTWIKAPATIKITVRQGDLTAHDLLQAERLLLDLEDGKAPQ